MSISYDVSLLIGESLTPGGFLSYPCVVTSSAQLIKAEAFAIFSPYGPIYFVARAPNLLDVPASGRKETHASPIYFWWRRFGEPSRNSSRVAALADCWRFRSVVVGGSGDSSYLNPSEPNLQKANGRKYRKGKDYKANNTEAKIVRKNIKEAQNRT